MRHESDIWYKSPAQSWDEALPLGNGRLGAMVYGRTDSEYIVLNEDSIWSGGFRNRNNPDAKSSLTKIRSLLTQGRLEQAENLTRYTQSGTPEYQRVYQILGELHITLHKISNVCEYSRRLSLDDAVNMTRYKSDGFIYEREVFVSSPADAIIIRLSTTNPHGMSLDARIIRNRFCEQSGRWADDTVFLSGANGESGDISFCCAMSGKAKGGEVRSIGEYLVFEGVNEAFLYITAATTFRESSPELFCRTLLASVSKSDYHNLRQAHISDYQRLERRMSLMLDTEDMSNIPTDERLSDFRRNPSDIGLVSLYFRFGRYLLISCSRPGTLPANLQGIWCKDFLSAWDSKYTININTEMNYWPAEPCNISDCHMPLFDHIKRMYVNGIETARDMYGARGFVAHHNTDIWGDTAPQDTYIPATYWVMGAAWLCLHIWEHYEYTLDTEFLAEHLYLLRDACLFFVDYLIENKNGELVISPSVSPENTYRTSEGNEGTLCVGCAMDSQILTELFNAFIRASKILDMDLDLSETIARMITRIPPIKVDETGRIMEWLEEYAEVEPGHRHISHLFALFPGNGISTKRTPELATAARKTLEQRLKCGGGHTGWSRAWIANFWAKLGDSEKVSENIDLLISNSTLPNLLDNHPPFQIDGNFGGITAIVNLLVRCEPDGIYLLTALPKKWRSGKADGIRLKGDLTIDIAWVDGILKSAKLYAGHDYDGVLYYGDKAMSLTLQAGQTVSLDGSFFTKK